MADAGCPGRQRRPTQSGRRPIAMKPRRSKNPEPRARDGMALIVVLIAIFVLSLLVGMFAFTMKVESRLAQHANNDTALVWLGRSGVERARWILAQQLL